MLQNASSLDDLSHIYFKFLFCCSRTEHKSVIIWCNVGKDSAVYLGVLNVTCYRPIVERYRWYSRCIIRRN